MVFVRNAALPGHVSIHARFSSLDQLSIAAFHWEGGAGETLSFGTKERVSPAISFVYLATAVTRPPPGDCIGALRGRAPHRG